MKRFFKILIQSSFWTFFYIILFIAIIVRSHHFIPSSLYYSNEFQSAFDGDKFDIVALGNSKLLSAVDKEILEKEMHCKVALLGYSSANISTSKLILNSYLNNNIHKPKAVLLEVSWFTFNTNRTYFHSVSVDVIQRDIKSFKYVFDYFPRIIKPFQVSFRRQLTSKIFPFPERNYDIEIKRPSPLTKSYFFSFNKFERTFANHRAGIDSILLMDFHEIIEICNIHNIPIILFTAPEDEEYSSLQLDRDEIYSVFYNSNCDWYFNYSKGGSHWDKKFEFWLRDSHHINERGLFTQELSKNLKPILSI